LTTAYEDIHREIVELSKTGNRKAQFELYKLYSKAMFNICMRIMNSREDAEDSLQDAFCEIFDKLKTFREESSFGAWAKKIVINTCINKLKKKKPELILDSIPEKPEDQKDQDTESLKLEVEKVLQAVSLLPDGYRLILNLYLFEGYDHREISQILGISESTSKSQYMKAKNKIKKLIVNQNER